MVQDDAAARELRPIRRRLLVGNRKLIPNQVYVGRLRDEGQTGRALQEERYMV